MNPLALDTIYARRPALTYVSPAICEAVFSSSSFPSLILDAVDPRNRNKVTGLVVTYTGGGDYLINFNNYPGALCYSVYKLNDATDPLSGYTIVAECITDQPFNPDDWVFPKPPPGTGVCYAFTVITADGESDFSDLICVFTDPDPQPPLPGTGCILNASPLPDGNVDEAYSETLLPNGPADVPQWTIWDGSLPPGLTLNIDSGIISGTPTEGGDFSFTVLLTKNGGGSCTKAFTIHIEDDCASPGVSWTGLSGVISTEDSPTLPPEEFIGEPSWGYSFNFTLDNVPRVAIVGLHWGEAQTYNWVAVANAESADDMAFAGYQTAVSTAIDKTLRVPIYPNGQVYGQILAPEATGIEMGDLVINTAYECVDITDLATITWAAPHIESTGSGFASGSASGLNWTTSVNTGNDLLGDTAYIKHVGTFTGVANGTAAKLILEVTNYDPSGPTPRFTFSVDSDLDGRIFDCTEDNGTWFTGNGTYEIPFVMAYTPGATLTVTIESDVIEVSGVGQMTLTAQFVPWS